ncbi:biliverdin-producing heme oxygenase [Paenibacillus sp. FJAT-26967]|uniref:biliverdin-producing heme oxygenase n=1 Tax=Paenibacillus sp. FJAT-26967 TaxID=1729690 RepID=UPI00083903CD|nr:biliverdin-producing heme oxygenase [Paenibacillus sp. FJAT-26967]
MNSTISARLKEETAPFHIQIEQNYYAKGIMNQGLTLEEYRTYLEKFYGFVTPAEQAITALPEWDELGFDIGSRMKSPLLEQDLIELGLKRADLNNLASCNEIPDLSTLPRALGYLYVLEGSTLGGQLITRQLKQFLPVTPESGGRYFSSYGTDLRTKWLEFRELLEQEAVTAGQQEEVLSAAKQTFILLNQWLVQEPVQPSVQP